jgi:hypothetical protein
VVGTVWDPIPAGSSELVNGVFTFPPTPLPAHTTMGLRVREAGMPGSLCRTRPVSSLPASGRPLHLLVAPPIAKSATDLNTMVASFKGLQAGTPSNVVLYISNTALVPTATGLELQLQGLVRVDTHVFFFAYRLPLTLTPVNGSDVNQVLTVNAPAAGTLDLAWFGTPPPNGAFIMALVKAGLQPQLRSNVLAKARPLVNSTVVEMHDVRWWTEQGFTLSVRNVSYATSGIKVQAALCRLS